MASSARASLISRPLVAAFLLALMVGSLSSLWRGRESRPRHASSSLSTDPSLTRPSTSLSGEPRRVVAHFMLGNTHTFTVDDWRSTFDLAQQTGLDGFALNLGHEAWQLAQARSAYTLASARLSAASTSSARPLRLFLSLDLAVLPSEAWDDAVALIDGVAELVASPAAMAWEGRAVLSTFGGERASWGGKGWAGFLSELQRRAEKKVFFWPAFFLPPEEFVALDHVGGTFAWNAGWPKDGAPIGVHEDEPFLAADKPYMAPVSPCFFTHYGKTGPFAWDKNWIYPSDDLLLVRRFDALLALAPTRAPAMLQLLSWNDWGESHYVAPVRGAEPGSEAWTRGMDHGAWRKLAGLYAARWRAQAGGGGGGGGGVEVVDGVSVWMWYRPQTKDADVADPIGRPDRVELARDLINLVVAVPAGAYALALHNAERPAHRRELAAGWNAWTVPFVAGPVSLELTAGGRVVLRGEGRDIVDRADGCNFNYWTGSWGYAPE